ncbi:substrate-binding periplasmic protein [Shewanella algae]|uniref:substrate-binding periplasmic protein n=1 Tax=Shewanella algae TaxID=38313 RepID=UPI0031F48F28
MRCLCCLLLLLFALPTWAKECQQGLTLAYNDWPPYAWTDAFGQPQGLDIEASRLISGKVGCPLSIEAIPAKRAHQMLKSGRIDLLAGATKLPQRQLYAHFSLAYRSEEVRIFVKQGHQAVTQVRQWQDVFSQRLRLILPGNGWYGADYQASKQRLSQASLLIISPNASQAVQMLAYDRGDAVVGDSLSVPFIAGEQEKLRLEALQPVLAQDGIHLMLSKVSVDETLLERFNLAIEALEADGSLPALRRKWQQISYARLSLTPSVESDLHFGDYPRAS